MKVSIQWLSDYIDIEPLKNNLKSVLAQLTMRGLEVESIDDLSKGFEKVIVAQILERNKHPNADRLSVCKVNTGSETIQVVCGAQNMKAGDKVALSQIGACLPNGLKIEKGKIRDVESFGMLCSETELGLAAQSDGILILPSSANVGQGLADFLSRNDIVFTLNVTPNRGDALSHYGVARELASILGQKLKTPHSKSLNIKTGLDEIHVQKISDATLSDGSKINLNKKCLQYFGRFFSNIKVQESPNWMKQRLLAVGLRPINNIVDITNFILMDMGQPLHAFDAGKIHGKKINIRLAKNGEKLPLLDQTEIELRESDLVIADQDRAIALAGVMGGANSEVSESTSSIFLEAAQFDPATVRKAAKIHQKNTDSSFRFERSVDPVQVKAAFDRASALICELSGAITSDKFSSQVVEALPRKKIKIDDKKINAFLGTNLTLAQIKDCLSSVGFEPAASDEVLVPTYRSDVNLSEDLYEEVLRVWGYDKVQPVVPHLTYLPGEVELADLRAQKIIRFKQLFAQLGFSEALNYGFTSKSKNQFWGGRDAEKAVSLANPLNEEFSTMKTSLITGLFDNLLLASRHQEENIRLFEVRPIYKLNPQSETGVEQSWRIAGIMSGKSFLNSFAAQDRSLDFFDLKGMLESVFESLNVRGVRFQPPSESDSRFHLAQSASIVIGKYNIGLFGRMHPKIESQNKLRNPVYLFELALDPILEMIKKDRKYSEISKFPKVQRDFSLIMPESMPAEKVIQAVQKFGKPLLESVKIVDCYRGEKIPEGKQSLSIHFILADSKRTLEDKEVDLMCQKILTGLSQELQVTLRLQ